MTPPSQVRFLAEVGLGLSKFACEEEAALIQEELAHHFDEQKEFLLGQGLTDEEAAEESISLVGSSREFVKQIRHSFRPAFLMLNAGSAFVLAAAALAGPLRHLTSFGVFSQALSILFSIGAFSLALSASSQGLKITLTRALALVIAAGFVLHSSLLIPAASGQEGRGAGSETVLAVTMDSVAVSQRFLSKDGRIVSVSPTDSGRLTQIVVEPHAGPQTLASLPEKYERLIAESAHSSARSLLLPQKSRAIEEEAYVLGAWTVTSVFVSIGAAVAGAIGRRRRRTLHAIARPAPQPLDSASSGS